MYDPSTARFLSKDPLEEGGSPPAQYLTKTPNVAKAANPNPYLYCANDPVNKLDPSGNEEFTIGENKKLTEVLKKEGISYTVHRVPTLGYTDGAVWPGPYGSYQRVQIVIIDAQDLDKARNVKFLTTYYPGLFSYTTHGVSWDNGDYRSAFKILRGNEKLPDGVRYYARPKAYGDYYPAINETLRLNYLAGYTLGPLLDLAEFGGDRMKSGRNAREPVRRLVQRGDISGAYRQYKTAAQLFPLFPGGGTFSAFIADVILPSLPIGGETSAAITGLIDRLPRDIVELIPGILALRSPQAALGPILRQLLSPGVDFIARNLGLNERESGVVRRAFELVIDENINSKTATELLFSLLRTDKRAAGLVDLIDLLSGREIENCESIIDLFRNLGLLGVPGSERRVKECCNKALDIARRGGKPEDLIKEILGNVIADKKDLERAERILDSVKALTIELRREKPDLSAVTTAASHILKDLLDKNDSVARRLVDALAVIGHSIAFVASVRTAIAEFKKGNRGAAIDALEKGANDVAKGAEAAGADGARDVAKAWAKRIRDNGVPLFLLLGLLIALGVNGSEDGGAVDPPADPSIPKGDGPDERRHETQTCTNKRLEEMQATKVRICDRERTSCSSGKVAQSKLDKVACSEARRRLDAAMRCKQIRQDIQDECFGGKTDAAHKNAIDEAQRAIESCQLLVDTNCDPNSTKKPVTWNL